eukprot:937027-Pyramimonas_sp.AAC.1
MRSARGPRHPAFVCERCVLRLALSGRVFPRHSLLLVLRAACTWGNGASLCAPLQWPLLPCTWSAARR